MRIRLTDLAVKKLSSPPNGQQTYWDETTPGFGVRCSTRSKSYVVMFGENRRLKTLGRVTDLALSDARKRAKLLLSSQAVAGSETPEYDYEAVVAEYIDDCRRRLRGTTLKGYELYLGNIAFKGPVSKVTQGEVLRAIEGYTRSPSSQNYAFTTFKVFFNWLVRRQFLRSNPLSALNRPNPTLSRDRVLNEDEVGTILAYTSANPGRFNNIVKLLLFTGQRKGEIAGLKWSEVDGDMLVLPPARTKNKHSHVVPLAPCALELLTRIEGGSTYVFGTREDDKPFNGWSRAQRRIIAETGLDHFTLHDLRRTFATLHAQIGTPIHVTERLLNHRSGAISGVAAVYNRHSYVEEMRDAMVSYDRHLVEIASRS